MRKLLNIFRLSLDNISRRKNIYLLLVCAVALGTAIIIFLLIFADGFERTAHSNLMMLPLNKIWLKPGGREDGQEQFKELPITAETLDALESNDSISGLWPQVDYGGASIIELEIRVLVYRQSFSSVVEVYGVKEDLIHDDLFDGCTFDYKEGGPYPVVLPEGVVRMLNANMSTQYLPEGKQFPLDVIKTFNTYVGLAVDPDKSDEKYRQFKCIPVGVSMNIPQIGVALPLEVVKEWNRAYGRSSKEGRYSRVLIETADPESASILAGQFEQKGFSIESSRNVYEQIKKIFHGVQAGILILGFLIIISVGIGLFNGLNLVVYSERDIIGVMRAVGAKRIHILEIILLQGFWIGLTGGVLGTVLASGVAFGLEDTLISIIKSYHIRAEDLFVFNWFYPAGGVLIPAFVCLLFGLIPGLRAISLKPAEVLK